MGTLTLVIGGARSGKSRFAQQLALRSRQPVRYVATAEALDDEMQARISRHRADRPPSWHTVERALGVDRWLETADGSVTLLIDCLSVWLSNELLTLPDVHTEAALLPAGTALLAEERLLTAVRRLVDAALRRPGDTIIVSNEAGAGVVPAYPLGRLYRDILGRANQEVARHAAAAYLVVAGIAVDLRRFEASPDNGAR